MHSDKPEDVVLKLLNIYVLNFTVHIQLTKVNSIIGMPLMTSSMQAYLPIFETFTLENTLSPGYEPMNSKLTLDYFPVKLYI